ncbi:MAG: hypothetical protein FWD98_00660 [Defluviitaleaceae bacterium]|nr:hypothetical protein [Defluviitaleaceae bacterium]
MLPITIMLFLLVMAGVIASVKANATAKMLAVGAFAVAFGLSAALLSQSANETIRLVIGAAPWNIYVLVTPLAAFMVCLFVGVSLMVVWASANLVDYDIEPARIPMYYALVCVLIASLVGVVIFGSLFNVFILMEVSSFAAAGIIVIKNRPENMRAGLKYLTLSILGSSFILMGIITLYALTGSLSVTGIHQSLSAGYAGNEVAAYNALMFITIGVALKSGLFPMHIAFPDAYSIAPSVSSALLSGLVQKAYIFFYIMVLHKAFGAEILLNDRVMTTTLQLVMILGAAAMIAGSAMALLQTDLKRMIAYSSVAQVGYFFLGVGMGTRLGLFAVVFHFLTHAVTKAMLFLVAGSVIRQTGSREIGDMAGLGTKMRVTMALFTVGALSMVGIPLLIGFNSKWFFAMGIFDSSHIWLLAVLALSSLLNGCYYLPVVVRAFFGDTGGEAVRLRSVRECAVRGLAPIVCLALLVVAFAVISGPVSYISIGIDSIW